MVCMCIELTQTTNTRKLPAELSMLAPHSADVSLHTCVLSYTECSSHIFGRAQTMPGCMASLANDTCSSEVLHVNFCKVT